MVAENGKLLWHGLAPKEAFLKGVRGSRKKLGLDVTVSDLSDLRKDTEQREETHNTGRFECLEFLYLH